MVWKITLHLFCCCHRYEDKTWSLCLFGQWFQKINFSWILPSLTNLTNATAQHLLGKSDDLSAWIRKLSLTCHRCDNFWSSLIMESYQFLLSTLQCEDRLLLSSPLYCWVKWLKTLQFFISNLIRIVNSPRHRIFPFISHFSWKMVTLGHQTCFLNTNE